MRCGEYPFYNVGTGAFAAAARFGARFERAQAVPPAPEGMAEVPRHYHRYRLGATPVDFQFWSRGTVLAQWGPIELGQTASPPSAAVVWKAIRRAAVVTAGIGSVECFGASLIVRPPGARRVHAAGLLKPFFDGVVAAFQHHAS